MTLVPSKQFVVRLLEQMAVTFLAGFVAALTVGGAGLSVSALAGAAAAGVRAVYGYLVKDIGATADTPSLK